MHYRYVSVLLCDECRISLLRLSEKETFHMTELDPGKSPSCQACGKTKVFTKQILTDYRVHGDLDNLLPLRAKFPRTLQEGFELLMLEDWQERMDRASVYNQ